MKRDEFSRPDSSDDAPTGAVRTDRARRLAWSRHLEGTLTILRYGSANLLLLLGSLALFVGGLAPWAVVVPALIFASFADEAAGDDDGALEGNQCLFCTLNLYLTVPLVALLAILLARFAGEHAGFSDRPFELIGAIWLVSYLFALVGATVAHEFTHRPGRLARIAAHILLGFTFNGSFVIYHIYAHHRQVGTYHDASTARRGERIRTFMARTLTQQFMQAARIEAARLERNGHSPWSWRNRLIQAHIPTLVILVLAGAIDG